MSALLIAYLFGLALLDSINPSALVVTAIILVISSANDRLKNIYSYVMGIFVSYLIIGLITLAGFSGLIEFVKASGASQLSMGFQAFAGALLVAYAILAPGKSDPKRQEALTKKIKKYLNPRLLFVYGMYVTVTELITALPYFAALTILAREQLPFAADAVSLIIYCAIFVTPPILMTMIYKRNKDKFDVWLKTRLQKRVASSRETMLWVVGVVGGIMFFRAVSKLDIVPLLFS